MFSMKLEEKTYNAMHCQEFPLLIVPYETLYRKYRLGQRIIDKEVSGINKFIKETDSGMNYNLNGLYGKPVYNFMNRSLQLSISES